MIAFQVCLKFSSNPEISVAQAHRGDGSLLPFVGLSERMKEHNGMPFLRD
jgi:hypothetical protein